MKIDIIEGIKSNAFATWAAIIAIIPQTLHSWRAFVAVEGTQAGWLEYIAAFVVASALDLAVLFFTLRNRKDIVAGSMVAMIVINVYVFWRVHQALTLDFAAGCFFGMLVPVVMYFYADTITGKRRSKS